VNKTGVPCCACVRACAPARRRSLCAASGPAARYAARRAWRRSACKASAGPVAHHSLRCCCAPRAFHAARPRLASAVAHVAQLVMLRGLTKRGGAPAPMRFSGDVPRRNDRANRTRRQARLPCTPHATRRAGVSQWRGGAGRRALPSHGARRAAAQRGYLKFDLAVTHACRELDASST
jgi:hypothetical protein